MLPLALLLAAAPSLSRGPVLVGVTPESAWVAWETDSNQADAVVKLGTTAGAYPDSVSDSSYGTVHHVQLTGLLPGTTYHYAIDSDALQQDSSFTTPPLSAETKAIKFIVYGDNRSNTTDHLRVVNAIRSEGQFDFVLHTGDMAQNYPGSDEWTTFFQVEHDLLRNSPLIPTIGNHETLDSLYTWSQYFSPPRFDPTPNGGVRYFSRDWGQIHVAVLDTFDQTGPAVDPKLDTISAAQMEWLKADLDAAQARKQIIFVSLHHGAVSHATGPEAHGGSDLVRNQIVPELQQRHVAAMFAGHDHIYERITPQKGIYHFVEGSSGQLRKGDARSSPMNAKSYDKDMTFMLVEIGGNQMSFQVISRMGATVDSGTIQRQVRPATRVAGLLRPR
jgi:predicted phosphodiesterase